MEAKTQFTCEHCGAKHKTYKFFFSTNLLRLLQDVWKHCKDTDIFDRKNIQLTGSQYSELAKLAYFGLLYKGEKGTWCIPKERVKQFFSGKCTIAEYMESNVALKTRKLSEKRVTVYEIVKAQYMGDYQDFYRQFVEYN